MKFIVFILIAALVLLLGWWLWTPDKDRALLAPGSRDALIARMAQTVLVDPVPWLKKITAPTLLLWGEQDALIPFSNAADYMQAIPRATLVSLPGIGHLPHEEAPEKTIVPLRRFLLDLP